MELPNSTDQIKESHSAKQIFILAGQSNMSGRGVVHNAQWDGVIPPDSAADPSRIFRLGPLLHWEAARKPLHQAIDSNRTCGVGPGMSFANKIKERVGAVWLVPCAMAGTAIKDWARGMAAFDNMVSRAKAAHGDGEIKALLWFQGEKDTFTEYANVYKEKIERFIFGVRQDLDLP